MHYWNEVLPDILQNNTINHKFYHSKPTPKRAQTFQTAKNVPPWLYPKPISKDVFNRVENIHQKGTKPTPIIYGVLKYNKDDENSHAGKIPDNMLGTEDSIALAGISDLKSGVTMNILIVAGGIFLFINVILFIGLYYKCIKAKSRLQEVKRTNEDTTEVVEGPSDKQDLDNGHNGCNLIKMISKSTKSEDTYEAVKTTRGSGQSKYKLARQMSSSTIDAHTKVRDWIAHEIVQRCSPKYFRRPRHTFQIERKEVKETPVLEKETTVDTVTQESVSTLGRSPTRPVSPVEKIDEREGKVSYIPMQKGKKVDKVSVAIDATPAARGPSVLRQQPIELTKSLDYGYTKQPETQMRRSVTLDDLLVSKSGENLKRSTTSINLEIPLEQPTLVRIQHGHSKSEPVQDFLKDFSEAGKKLRTFDPNQDIYVQTSNQHAATNKDVNVTSRDESEDIPKELTPQEALQTIKRRNFPKVLPDFPGNSRQYFAQKRMSMPTPNSLYTPSIPLSSSQPVSPSDKSLNKMPPAPPPRTTSTLGRKLPMNSGILMESPVMFAKASPVQEEPEIACNNLYVGPLIKHNSSNKGSESYKLNTQPIYDNLNSPRRQDAKTEKSTPKTIITTDPANPVKRVEPKVIIKPTISRNISDPSKNKGIARVTATDNASDGHLGFKNNNDTAADSKSRNIAREAVVNACASITGNLLINQASNSIKPIGTEINTDEAVISSKYLYFYLKMLGFLNLFF